MELAAALTFSTFDPDFSEIYGVNQKRKICTINTEKPPKTAVFPRKLVRVTGFEPAASCSQSRRATNCATPGYLVFSELPRVFPKQARYQRRFALRANLRNPLKSKAFLRVLFVSAPDFCSISAPASFSLLYTLKCSGNQMFELN